MPEHDNPNTAGVGASGPEQARAPRDRPEIEVAVNLLERAQNSIREMRGQLQLCHAKLSVLDLVDRLISRGNVGMGVEGVAVDYEIGRWLEHRKRRDPSMARAEQRASDHKGNRIFPDEEPALDRFGEARAAPWPAGGSIS